jgi:hypothetical protein
MTEKNATEKNATEKNTAEKSTAEKSTAEKSTAEKSTAEKNMTEKAVESILFRARRELRQRLAKHQPAEPSRNGKRPRANDVAPDVSVNEDTSQKVL